MNNIVLYLLPNLILAPLTIIVLRNWGFYKTKKIPKEQQKKMNNKYYKHLFDSMNTPSSFGVLFILNIIVFSLLNYSNLDTPLLFILIGSIALGLLGFADDIYQFFFYTKVKQWGFKARYKMAVQLSVIFVISFMTFNSLLIAILISVFAVFVLNSFNITDGLDGLAGGVLVQVIPIYLFLEYKIYGVSNYSEVLTFTLAFLIVFLIFNIKPAKVWLGDSGSYALGTLLAIFTFRYPLIYSIPLISIFLLEGLSSLIQIISLKVFKKRVFTIAPLHLHLLNNGWSQWKVILTAWVTQLIISVIVLVLIINVR